MKTKKKKNYHTGSPIKNRFLFLTVLECRKSKTKEPAGLVSGEKQLPDSLMAIFSLCPHIVKGVAELSGISFIRTLIPFMKVVTS